MGRLVQCSEKRVFHTERMRRVGSFVWCVFGCHPSHLSLFFLTRCSSLTPTTVKYNACSKCFRLPPNTHTCTRGAMLALTAVLVLYLARSIAPTAVARTMLYCIVTYILCYGVSVRLSPLSCLPAAADQHDLPHLPPRDDRPCAAEREGGRQAGEMEASGGEFGELRRIEWCRCCAD